MIVALAYCLALLAVSSSFQSLDRSNADLKTCLETSVDQTDCLSH